MLDYKHTVKKLFAVKKLKEGEENLMKVAKDLIHDVFVKFPAESPRFVSLRSTTALDLERRISRSQWPDSCTNL